jgi:hypothetical protein
MPTQVDLATVPRRDIRYVMICLQQGTEIVKHEHVALVPAIEDFMRDNQRKIEDFGSAWDIGIDTIDTMHMRPESWWLWGIAHTRAVDRPQDSTNVLAGFNKIFASGFGDPERKPQFNRDDYARILESANERTGW